MGDHPAGHRPSILLLHCHDLGRHLGALGARTVRTPNLDRLAAEGVVCEQMFASAPQCSPSRASLFTGRWPHANGVMGLTHRGFAWDLNPDEVHLAARLAEVGHRCELVGVQHETRPVDAETVAARLGHHRAQPGGTAEVVADRTVEALHRLAGEPFFLQVGFYEPHRTPGRRDAPGVMGFLGDHVEPDASLGIEVPRYLVDDAPAREEVAELQGAIHHLDTQVGRVLDTLDALGIAESTVVVFTTDHGLALPRAKCSLYDPGLEIACLLRWPAAGWTGGRRLGHLLTNLDVLPTLVEALQLPPRGRPVQGRSFLALLEGRPERYRPAEAVFGELTYHDYYDPRRTVRTERHRLVVNFSAAPEFMDPSQGWRRRCTPVPGAPHPHTTYHPDVELYDVEQDPFQLRDLAEDPVHAAPRDHLLDLLADWMRRTEDPLLAGAVTSPSHRRSLTLLGRGPLDHTRTT